MEVGERPLRFCAGGHHEASNNCGCVDKQFHRALSSGCGSSGVTRKNVCNYVNCEGRQNVQETEKTTKRRHPRVWR
jgi:hypothetical protein